MKLSRHTLLATVLTASGLMFTMLGSAHAQTAVYRNVSGHGYGHGCPCPCPDAEAPAGEEPTPATDGLGEDLGEDLPEVADLSSDAAYAGGSQSAAPMAIGDSNYPGFNVSSGILSYTLDPAGGRRYKATHNNSAVPQSRAYFNYNYYNNAFHASAGALVQEIDAHSYEVGGEYAFWCGMASVQVNVPVIDQFAADQVNLFPLATDAELGNVQVALKTVLCQDCCQTVSAGLGIDLPTADDISVNAGTFGIENDAVIVSPFLAVLRSLNSCAYVQGFAQVAIPVNENTVNDGPIVGEIQQPTLLYLDFTTGYWLSQDCCGNGLVANAELHYTNALDDEAAVVGAGLFQVGDYELLNATIGVTAIHNCWSVTPALVLPLFDDTDRAFDYEIAVQVNRRF